MIVLSINYEKEMLLLSYDFVKIKKIHREWPYSFHNRIMKGFNRNEAPSHMSLFIFRGRSALTDQIGLILNTMMLSLSFPANIKYSHKTPILFLFIGVQTKFFLRGCWTRLDIINRRLGATSSSWVHCTFSQTSCCKNDFRNVSRILSLSCLVHLVEYARIHSFL